MFCRPTLESTLSLISIVPCWLGLNGTRGRWLFRKSWVCDNNELQAARKISWELLVTPWTRSFTVRVTESGPKSKDDSIPPLETEKIMLLYCRLRVYKISSVIKSSEEIAQTVDQRTEFTFGHNNLFLEDITLPCR